MGCFAGLIREDSKELGKKESKTEWEHSSAKERGKLGSGRTEREKNGLKIIISFK